MFLLPKLHITLERWKYNKDYDVYVSNLGSFKSANGENLKISISSTSGYCRVKCPKARISAHRLVLATWNPIPNMEKFTVDHLDHNHRNNNLKNLEWVTDKENQERAIDDLTYDYVDSLRYERLIKEKDKQNRKLKEELNKLKEINSPFNKTPVTKDEFYVKVNGTPITKNEIKLISLAFEKQNARTSFLKKIDYFVTKKNPNPKTSYAGMEFTRID